MLCPRCGVDNPIPARFCTRCHEPLWFVCGACGTVQTHGGTCDQCGVDFAKFANVLVTQHKDRQERDRERRHERQTFWKQLLLLPVTGGLSLLRHLFSRARE